MDPQSEDPLDVFVCGMLTKAQSEYDHEQLQQNKDTTTSQS